MEKVSKNEESKLVERLNNIINNKTQSDLLKNVSSENSGITTKNVFLSLPKLNTKTNHYNKSYLKTINLTFNNRRNKTIEFLSTEGSNKTENIREISLKKNNRNKNSLINIKIIGKKTENNFPKNKASTILIDNTHFDKINPKNETQNFNTININLKKHNLKKLKNPYNTLPDKKRTKTQDIHFYHKKPTIDYNDPILKSYKFNEISNLRRLNLGDLLTKKSIKDSCICLLDDDSKEDYLSPYFKLGNKYFEGEKLKDLKERNEFFSKLKILYDEDKRRKKRKKFSLLKNCHEILDYYRNNRVINCRKLIEQTLEDTKKTKKTISNYFEQYKTVFDQYDDWNSPKNENNLYNE